MKSPTKPCFLLLCLIAGIYVMRNADVSFGNALKYPLRLLQEEYRPSKDLDCPASIEDAFTESEKSRADGFKSSLQGMRNGNPLKDVLTSGSMSGFASDYALPLIPFIAPWIVLLVLSIIATLVLCCNWCCVYGCCKKAKCCKCCKAPKDAKRKRIYIALSAFFLLGTFGSGIAGIVVSSQVSKGMELTICSLIQTAEHLAYGDTDNSWIGITKATGSIKDLKAHITDAINDLPTNPIPDNRPQDIEDAYDNNITPGLTALVSSLDVAGNKNKNRPDPAQTSNPTYTPDYILGIKDLYSKKIDAECVIKKEAVKDAHPVITGAIDAIKTQSGDITLQIDSAQSSLDDIDVSVKDFLKTLGDFGGTAKDIIKIIGTVLQAIFIVVLVLGVFGLASMVLVGFLKIKFFNKFLHFNWCVLLLFTIFGWVLACLFYPLSIVLMESCDVLDSSLNDKSTLKSILGTLVDDSGDDGIGGTMSHCLFEDGDMASKLNLQQKLKSFTDIFNELGNLPSNIPIEDSDPPCLTWTEQKSEVADWKSGKTADSSIISDDLKALTNAVNKQYTSCTTLRDTWQLTTTNCPANPVPFAGTNPSEYEAENPICIGLDVWTVSPPAKVITDRYKSSRFPSCPANGAYTAESYASTFVTKFVSNRNDVKTIFTSADSALDTFKGQYDVFASKLRAVLKDFKATETAVNKIQDSLTGTSSGLLTNLKCSFIGDDMRRVSDSMCVGFISGVYQSSVVIIISSVFSLFGSIFVFCLAKRFILETKDAKAKPV